MKSGKFALELKNLPNWIRSRQPLVKIRYLKAARRSFPFDLPRIRRLISIETSFGHRALDTALTFPNNNDCLYRQGEEIICLAGGGFIWYRL